LLFQVLLLHTVAVAALEQIQYKELVELAEVEVEQPMVQMLNQPLELLTQAAEVVEVVLLIQPDLALMAVQVLL
jgi:hypothetical protein